MERKKFFEKAGGKIGIEVVGDELVDWDKEKMLIEFDISQHPKLSKGNGSATPYAKVVQDWGGFSEGSIIRPINLKYEGRKLDGLKLTKEMAEFLNFWYEKLKKRTEILEEQRKKEAYKKLLNSKKWEIWIGCDTGTRAIPEYCDYVHREKYHRGGTWTWHCDVCDNALRKCKVETKTDKDGRYIYFVDRDEALRYLKEEEEKEKEKERQRAEKERKLREEEQEALKKAKETGKEVYIRVVGGYDGDEDGSERGWVVVWLVATPDGKLVERESPSY